MKKILFSLFVTAALCSTETMKAQTVLFEDSFETYTDFAIANVGSWTLTDVDLKTTYGFTGIAFNRPEVRNAFRPKTTSELYDAFYHVSEDSSVGVVLLTGEGPSPKDGGHAFCSGGDQKARGEQGYVGEDGRHRLNILEVQRLIRFMPKVVIAVVNGWAVGGGHSLHVVCDLTLASEEHAIFKQTDADVTSIDGG